MICLYLKSVVCINLLAQVSIILEFQLQRGERNTKGGTPGVRYFAKRLRPLRLHHLNYQRNVVSTGKNDIKSENMIGIIT